MCTSKVQLERTLYHTYTNTAMVRPAHTQLTVAVLIVHLRDSRIAHARTCGEDTTFSLDSTLPTSAPYLEQQAYLVLVWLLRCLHVQ